jgi:hypothetical protein
VGRAVRGWAGRFGMADIVDFWLMMFDYVD